MPRPHTRRYVPTRFPDKPPRRIGVVGGTFDPIHNGHLVAGSEVADMFGLDLVIYVPTGHPWQKRDKRVTAAEDRYLMTVIATASNPLFLVSRVDIDRPGATYTVDTLKDIQRRYPEAELFFITGADALERIVTWKHWEDVFNLAHCVGVTRPGYNLEDAGEALRSQVDFRPTEPGEHPGDGDFLDRHPGAGVGRPVGLVPGARRCGAVHRQDGAVPRQPPWWPAVGRGGGGHGRGQCRGCRGSWGRCARRLPAVGAAPLAQDDEYYHEPDVDWDPDGDGDRFPEGWF